MAKNEKKIKTENGSKATCPLSTWVILGSDPDTEPKTRRQVMKYFITVVGMDVHKDSIEIVIAETTGTKEVRHYGKINGDMASLDKAVRKLKSTSRELHFVYGAGPCGYEIYRHLSSQGFTCVVVAPSKTPRRSGDRIKTTIAMPRRWPGFIEPDNPSLCPSTGRRSHEGFDPRPGRCGQGLAHCPSTLRGFSASVWPQVPR